MRNCDCDIAMEIYERSYRGKPGVSVRTTREKGDIVSAELEIETARAAEAIGKPAGKYVTLYSDYPQTGDSEGQVALARVAAAKMRVLVPSFGSALVIGIGNAGMICDSLGQKTAERVIATRHLGFGRGALPDVSAFPAGVAGRTGIESVEVVDGLVSRLKPDLLVLVDSLCAGSAERIGRTLQISDTGLAPGSGVSGRRARIDAKSYGVPVLGVGIPLMIYARSLVPDGASGEALEGLVVTPREIDDLAARCAFVLSAALNFYFLENSLSQQEILSLMREI